jgi:hypothetical protein
METPNSADKLGMAALICDHGYAGYIGRRISD